MESDFHATFTYLEVIVFQEDYIFCQLSWSFLVRVFEFYHDVEGQKGIFFQWLEIAHNNPSFWKAFDKILSAEIFLCGSIFKFFRIWVNDNNIGRIELFDGFFQKLCIKFFK